MPLVAVIDIRFYSDGKQSPHSPNAEDQLLLQAVLGVTAIEIVGDCPVLRCVILKISVEEIKLNLAYRRQPQPGLHGTSGPCKLYGKLIAATVLHRFNRNLRKVLSLIYSLLFTPRTQLLPEITVPVE